MAYSKDDILLIAKAVAEEINQQQSQQAGQQTAEQIQQSINSAMDRLSGQSQSQDQSATSNTSRTVDSNIEDPGADGAMKAVVAFDHQNFGRNKKVDGDLYTATAYIGLWQNIYQLAAMNAATIRAAHNAVTIDQKTLDVQDSATPAK